jgi:hypothetical protein
MMAVRLYHAPMTFGTGRRRSGAWSTLGRRSVSLPAVVARGTRAILADGNPDA